MSAIARKRRQAAKKDPYRAQILAPLHTQPSNTCSREGCGHPWLIHGYDGACLTVGCGCGEWVEP